MGFLVTGSITTPDNQIHDSFYVRIENYQLNKTLGYLYTQVTHYTSKETAATAHPIYREDYQITDASGAISNTFMYNSVGYNWTNGHEFPLLSPESVTVTTYSSSFSDDSVDYIDFDDDGNEVTKTRTERVETITTGSEEVTKNKININLITGNPYEYAYKEVKDFYKGIFGDSNVNDLI
jgi:hypothetical protein